MHWATCTFFFDVDSAYFYNLISSLKNIFKKFKNAHHQSVIKNDEEKQQILTRWQLYSEIKIKHLFNKGHCNW